MSACAISEISSATIEDKPLNTKGANRICEAGNEILGSE
jgi:hypothetical protein